MKTRTNLKLALDLLHDLGLASLHVGLSLRCGAAAATEEGGHVLDEAWTFSCEVSRDIAAVKGRGTDGDGGDERAELE